VRNAGGVGTSSVLRPVQKSLHWLRRLTDKNLCPSATVVHDGALAEEYAVSSTSDYDASRNLMITVTVQLTSMSRH